MDPQESGSYRVLDWEGPRSVVIPRGEAGFGFTLRHFVVYPPQSVLDDSRSELDGGDGQGGNRPELGRELSIEPQDTIFVKSVKEESPAHFAGLQTGDRIIAVNGNSISGKSYREVIAAIHQSSPTLKLLVVPKDEDILQMAYQSYSSTESYGPGATNNPAGQGQPGLLRSHLQHHSHSSGDLSHEIDHYGQRMYSSTHTDIDRQEVRHSYPLSHWDSPPSVDRRFAVPQPQNSGQYRREPLSQSRENWQKQYFPEERGYPQSYEQEIWESDMAYNIPTKAKYSFGLYFPPKAGGANNGSMSSSRTISAESLGKSYEVTSEASNMPKSQTFDVSSQRQSDSSQRKSSLDESSALTSSARSRDYFIRYSSDRAANDLRNRYTSRQPGYKSQQPTYIISRSQTVSTISPSKSTTSTTGAATFRHSADLIKSRMGEEGDYKSDQSRVPRYIPIVSSPKHIGSSENIDIKVSSQKPQAYQESSDSSGSRTFVVRIPFDRQQQQAVPISRPSDSSSMQHRQNYGTTFALTRAPNAAHIEIQKSIGKPIVSQRKNQFETGKNENTPPLGSAGYNRYKTEIEKIRTQPKFSSIAMRRASFEQSPEKEPSGSCSDDSRRSREQTPSEYGKTVTDTAQPTVKVRKISAEHFKSGSPHEAADQAPIRIYVSPGSSHDSSSPIVEIVPVFSSNDAMKRNSHAESVSTGSQRSEIKVPGYKGSYHSPSPSSCSGSSASGGGGGAESTGMVDSGVWIKSYHSSLDMLDGVGDEEESQSGGVDSSSIYSGERPGVRGSLELDGRSRPARKTSYLSAVNAPHTRGAPYQQTEPPTAIESRAGYLQTPQQAITKSQALPYPTSQVASILQPGSAVSLTPGQSALSASSQQQQLHVQTSKDGEQLYRTGYQGSSHSLNSVSTTSSGVPVASVAPTVMTSSDSLVLLGQHPSDGSQYGSSVILRKKLPESLEDQANKLHRRTSYLMATARDRANTVPIEQAFSPPQPIMEVAPGEQQCPVRQSSSAKLNKFFGETIPEGVEFRANDIEEEPEIIRKGLLSCKISVIEGKKCSDRSWKPVYAVLRQNEMYLTKDKDNAVSSNSAFEDQHIPLRACLVECAREYAKKKKHVFRLTSHQECEYLFQTEDKGTMLCWIQAIKSINEPEKAEQMEPMIASEQAKHSPIPVEIHSSSKTSPQLGSHKGRKLSALSLKTKLATSPSMRRKKSSAGEKDKSGEEHLKKSWKGRIPMMKSLKKSSDDSHALAKPNLDTLQFGVPLEDCFPSPNNEYVPLIVELCTSIVEARGLEVIGVYRVPGNSAAVNALTDEFNRGIENVNIHNEKLLDINVISSLLKSFFRKLPEPLVPEDSYDAFIQANRCPDENKRKLKLKRLLYMLPVHHNETFKHMAEHLNKVASYGNINKMDAKNLALMFGPTLVKKKMADTDSLVHDMSDQCCIVESIILHHDWFFSAWDQDNYIPTETKVEPVVVDDNHTEKDDDDEAELAISTKEIISSIVSAASKKLKVQKEKPAESLDVSENSTNSANVSTNYKERSSDESTVMSYKTKSLSSIASSRSASEEFLDSKSSTPTNPYLDTHGPAPIASSESDFMDLEFADARASSPLSSKFSHHFSKDSLMDKNDELEISHGLPTSVIHNRLKRINNDVNVVSALLQSIEQEHMKERERWRREQELLEREQQRTQLELEEEDSIDDLLAWKGSGSMSHMPDLVSSSYVGDSFPYDHSRPSSSASDKKRSVEQGYMVRPLDRRGARGSVPQVLVTSAVSPTASQEETITQTKSQIQEAMRSSGTTLGTCHRGGGSPKDKAENSQHLAVSSGSRPNSLRHSFTRRHGSLDSLIDLLDKEKRSSWASSDSEDGSDLLTSITTTFDQKLQILLNPKYKLTGGRRSGTKESRSDSDSNRMSTASRASLQSFTASALVDPNDSSFKDPSLHRSSRSDPKIGIASRFERVSDTNRASSSSPVTVGNVQFELGPSGSQQRKALLPDFKSFLGRNSTGKDTNPVVLTQPKKLDSGNGSAKLRTKPDNGRPITKSEKTERNSNLVRRSREESSLVGQKKSGDSNAQSSVVPAKKANRSSSSRRHTVGGTEDLEHVSALAQICRGQHSGSSGDRQELRQSAWEQLQPVVKDTGSGPDRSMQDWIQRERLRGSTPDLATGQE